MGAAGLAVSLGHPLHAGPLAAAALPGFSSQYLIGLMAALALGLLYIVTTRLLRSRSPGIDGDPREDRRLRMIVIVLLGLFFGAVLANLAISLRNARSEILTKTEHTAANLAHVLGQQTAGSFNSVDIALRVIASLFSRPVPAEQMALLLRARAEASPGGVV